MKKAPKIERVPFGGTTVQLGEVGPPDDEGMLNAQEAAEYLGVSAHKISRLVRAGDLPAYRWTVDRRHRRFDRFDLELLRPRVVDVGNPWDGTTTDDLAALNAVHERIARHGVAPGPGGYDLARLIEVVEDRGWAWRVEKESGPWRFYKSAAWSFQESPPAVYWAEINRGYRPGLGGYSVKSHAWRPEIALARSLDRILLDEATGASILP